MQPKITLAFISAEYKYYLIFINLCFKHIFNNLLSSRHCFRCGGPGKGQDR